MKTGEKRKVEVAKLPDNSVIIIIVVVIIIT